MEIEEEEDEGATNEDANINTKQEEDNSISTEDIEEHGAEHQTAKVITNHTTNTNRARNPYAKKPSALEKLLLSQNLMQKSALKNKN